MKENFKKTLLKILSKHLYGGGLLFLISLSLISGGFASFLVSSSVTNVSNGKINVGDVINDFCVLDKSTHYNGYTSFTICRSGFINNDGLISNTGYITYYLNIDLQKASYFINGDYILLSFYLTEHGDGIFINQSTNNFDVNYKIGDSEENSIDTQYSDTKTITTGNIQISTASAPNILKTSVSFEFTINSTTNFETIIGSINTIPNFSLMIEGVRNG